MRFRNLARWADVEIRYIEALPIQGIDSLDRMISEGDREVIEDRKARIEE